MDIINKDILRWVLLLAAMPIWLPFLRMLWKDFNRALEDEGGVFGKAPTAGVRKLTDRMTDPWTRDIDIQVSPVTESDNIDFAVQLPGRVVHVDSSKPVT